MIYSKPYFIYLRGTIWPFGGQPLGPPMKNQVDWRGTSTAEKKKKKNAYCVGLRDPKP